MIPFPDLDNHTADAVLDELLADYLRNPPDSAGCWSLDPSRPADLGIRLLARGFQPGWKPCWMGLDLDKLVTDHPVPEGLEIIADNTISLTHIKDLPYNYNCRLANEYATSTREYPDRVQQFVAMLNGKIIGHSSVLLNTGAYAAAGIYNVGVVSYQRRRGIGKAVVAAACKFAKEQGYGYAVLNATGRRMYEQIGFQWISDGSTWWLMQGRLEAHPPTKKEIIMAEAIGRGDMEKLNELGKEWTKEELSQPLTNKMTLKELAKHCKQSASLQWLASH